MKKILLILLCLPMIGFGQKTYVPDDNFENYLEASGMGDGIQLNDSVSTVSIEMLISLDISFQNISDLTGIEDFISLSVLYCWNNNLTTLDISHNIALTELHCQDNNLTTLDLSNNTLLTDLRCQFTGITSIDLSGAISLTDLRCQHNQLTSLDISQNVNLLYLDCKYNQLTQLDLRNGNNMNMVAVLFENPDLFCINVDDEFWSTMNWTNIDSTMFFSTNCNPSEIEEQTKNKELLKVTDLLGRETKPQTNTPFIEIYYNGTVEKRIVIE